MCLSAWKAALPHRSGVFPPAKTGKENSDSNGYLCFYALKIPTEFFFYSCICPHVRVLALQTATQESILEAKMSHCCILLSVSFSHAPIWGSSSSAPTAGLFLSTPSHPSASNNEAPSASDPNVCIPFTPCTVTKCRLWHVRVLKLTHSCYIRSDVAAGEGNDLGKDGAVHLISDERL